MKRQILLLNCLVCLVYVQVVGQALNQEVIELPIPLDPKSMPKIVVDPNTDHLLVVFFDYKNDEGVILEYDPYQKKEINKVSLPLKKPIKKISLSMDGRYLVINPGSNMDIVKPAKKFIVYDVQKRVVVFEANRKTEGVLHGFAFTSNDEFVYLEKSSVPEIVKRSIVSNEIVQRRPVPSEILEYGPIITELAYSPISPWNVPILMVSSFGKTGVLNATTLELLITLNHGVTNTKVTVSLRNYAIIHKKIVRLEDGELVGSCPIDNGDQIIHESSLQLFSVWSDKPKDVKWKDAVWKLKVYPIPKLLKEEIAYKNWLKAAEIKKDSLLNITATVQRQFEMNSPEGDWIYLGDQGIDGKAFGMGDAIRKDGVRFIKNGFFENGDFMIGKMENVYGVSMEGEFKNMKLNGFGRHITENKAILEGEFVDGLLEGKGETIDPSGLSYVGEFQKGTFSGKGKITRPDGEMFDGEFLNGKPHGSGIYKNGGTIERVEYYEGQRIDQAYQMKVQADRMERQQKMAELQAKQKQAYLAAQQNKKSSNGLFTALAMGAGAGLLGSSAGMDAMQAMEFGTSMFSDIQSGGTSNLESFKSGMMADFEAKKPSYGQEAPAYTAKKNEKNCDLATIYEGPDGGQGGAFCAQATLFKCEGLMDRVATLCKQFKSVSAENCPVCN
jgi:hypothetical protein